MELQRPYERGDARRSALLSDLAEHLGVGTLATGNVHAHHPSRLRLQDVLVAIHTRAPLDGCERERRAWPRVGAPAAGGDAPSVSAARSWSRRAQCRAG